MIRPPPFSRKCWIASFERMPGARRLTAMVASHPAAHPATSASSGDDTAMPALFYQRVYPAEAAHHGVPERRACGGIGKVRLKSLRATTNLGRKGHCPSALIAIVNRNSRARTAHRAGDGGADASTCAGDQNVGVRQVDLHGWNRTLVNGAASVPPRKQCASAGPRADRAMQLSRRNRPRRAASRAIPEMPRRAARYSLAADERR